MMADLHTHMVAPGAPLPEGADPLLRLLLRYWQSKCRGAVLPRRCDIDPTEIPALLPAIFLIDVEPGDFRFRLVGEEVVLRYGSLKGRSLSEVMSGPELAHTLAEHRACVRTRRPVYSENTLASARTGDELLYQRLLVPLADGMAVNILAGVMAFRSYASEVAGYPWVRRRPSALRPMGN